MTRRPTGGSHNGSANGGEQSHSADPVNGSADGRQLDDTSQLDGAQPDEGGPDEGGLDEGGLAEGGLDSLSLLGLTPDPEPEAEPADPFPGEGTEGYRHDSPRPEHKPVVRAVEETGSGRPGIAATRGNVAHLSANPRARLWQQRVIAAIIIMVVFSVLVSWQLGLTLAVIAIIADTIYRSRRGYSGQAKVRMNGAQRQTRRQLAKLGRAGYRAVHANLIPGSEDQIDHLVVGPAGVFAIDSEGWDKRLIVRVKNHRQLWHGPFSKKERLDHAVWEAQRAAQMLSGAVGKPVMVRPAMAVYGPKIPWDVVTIRDVDVFSGPRLRKYLRRQGREAGVRGLSEQDIERIYEAASEAFPHLSTRTATH
jgi:Nuclease-related domain